MRMHRNAECGVCQQDFLPKDIQAKSKLDTGMLAKIEIQSSPHGFP